LIRKGISHICIFILLAAGLCACRARLQEDDSPRLVILYVTCTVNNNYLSPYNNEVTFTPNLERFSREAAVFLSHQTESGISGTSFASIFSGTQAD